jgi:hypothetical protein
VAEEAYGFWATYVPRLGTVNTRPSVRSMSIARNTVSRPTSYVSCSALTLGRGPVDHSPAAMRERNTDANCS